MKAKTIKFEYSKSDIENMVGHNITDDQFLLLWDRLCGGFAEQIYDAIADEVANVLNKMG
jgi:hypothetical protein